MSFDTFNNPSYIKEAVASPAEVGEPSRATLIEPSGSTDIQRSCTCESR